MFRPAAQDEAPAPVDPAVHQGLCTSQAPARAIVVANRVCTTGPKAAAIVRHIELDIGDTPLAGRCRAGQCIGVMPPGHDAQGRPIQSRLFSLASPSAGEDGSGRVISLTVKRLLAEDRQTHQLRIGLASNHLCDRAVGDPVLITGPVGRRLVLPQNADQFNYLLLATGTGIAPLRGITLDLLAAGHPRAILLYAGSAYATDLLYQPQLSELAAKHPVLRYVPTLSRHSQPQGGEPAMYVHQRLLRDHRLLPLLHDPRTLLYVCGLAGMELGVFQALATLLPPDVLGGYVRVKEPGLLERVGEWDISTLKSLVRPGPRARVEVY